MMFLKNIDRRSFTNIIISASITLCLALTSCKKSTSVTTLEKGYFRMIVLDAPQNVGTIGKAQFYWDGRINANGDSILRKPDGSLYSTDQSNTASKIESVSVNFPSGGWVDNPHPDLTGVYSFSDSYASLYSYFPNSTHRVQLAPIIGPVNYYRWASFDAGSHDLEFKRINRVNSYGTTIEVQGPSIYKNKYALEAGAIQTLFLYNTGIASYYDWDYMIGADPLIRLPKLTGNEIYQPSRNIAFTTDNYNVITLKDHPNKLPAFKDSSAYVRFLNFSPIYLDPAANERSDYIDIYLAPLYGPKSNLERVVGQINSYQSADTKNQTTAGPEFLVASNLKRFDNSVDAPFYELPMAPYLRGDTVGRNRYFRVLAYRAGESAEKGNAPLASNDWLTIYNQFSVKVSRSGPPIQQFKSWLVRSSGAHYYPTINTIAIAVGTGPNPTTDASMFPINQPPLLIRSVIQYTQKGLETDYLKF